MPKDNNTINVWAFISAENDEQRKEIKEILGSVLDNLEEISYGNNLEKYMKNLELTLFKAEECSGMKSKEYTGENQK